MKRFAIAMLLLLGALETSAQYADRPGAVLTSASFRDNWYFEAGLDLSLQIPYTYDFADSFKEGSSWGVSAAVGKWFTPEIGARFKVIWENGIPLFGYNKANWLAPFFEPGENMKRGGFIVVAGDIPFDINNILFGYNPERKWNVQIFPKAGIAYNFGVSKGTPLLAIGWGNTFKLNGRTTLFADLIVNAVSSGFTGDGSTFTDTGSGFNAFLNVNFGAQFALGKGAQGFRRISEAEGPFNNREVVVSNGFWRNWFIQAGLDMTLQFPYNQDYSKVWTKGRTFGFDIAAGKWFSPEFGVRGKLNWENGCPLFENKKLAWVATDPLSGKTNMQSGGYITLVMDFMLNLHSVISGFERDRKWNSYIFGRGGIGSNLAIESGSPLVGLGLGISRRLNGRISLFADTCYQSITSEFVTGVEGANTGMGVSTGHNAFVDLNFGVQIELGKKQYVKD